MEIFDAGTLGDGHCCGELDLDIYAVRTSEDVDLVRYQALIAHESGHWARWHGTTLGSVLSLMRYASQRLVRDSLALLTPAERNELLNARSAGLPMFGLNGPPRHAREAYGVAWQIWTDLHVAYSVLYDWRRVRSISWNMMEAVASALTDVIYWAQPLHGVGRRPHRVSFSQGAVGLHEVDGDVLSSRVLYEAIGMADELSAWYSDKTGPERSTTARFMNTLVSSYGVPIRILNHFLGDESNMSMERAVTAAFVADFSLNPPIPPYVPLKSNSVLEWDDIYPPARYVRCCNEINSLGLLSAEPTNEEYVEYSAALSSLTGMPDPRKYAGGILRTGERLADDVFEFEDVEVGSDDHARVNGDYVAFLTWVQRKMWEHRLREPALFHQYGQATLRKDKVHRVEYLFGEKGAGWYFPQFARTASGVVGFSSDLSPDTAAQYFASIALYLSMHHFASSASMFDIKRVLPTDGFQSVLDEVSAATSRLVGGNFWLPA